MSYEQMRTHEVGRASTEQGYRPSTAKKWDVLQLNRLKNVAELGLDYRTQPVLNRQDGHYAIFIIGLIGFLSMLLNTSGSLTSRYLETPFIFALFSAIGILVGLYSFFTDRSKWVAGVYALLGPGLWGIAVLPSLVHRYPSLGYVLFLVSLGLVCYLAQCIANHYAKWLSASPQLVGERRKKAEAKWENHHYEGYIIIGSYGILLILCAGTPILGFSAFLWMTLFFTVGIVYRATGFKDVRKTCSLCWAALVSWLTYHRYQAVHIDFVDVKPPEQHTYHGMRSLFRLMVFGILILFISFVISPAEFMKLSIGKIASTVMMLIVFLITANAVYVALYTAYDLNGTIFPHSVSPPGLFRSPGGHWIIRNLLTAGILGALFITTIHFIAYAPLGLLSSPLEPLLIAFCQVVESKCQFAA